MHEIACVFALQAAFVEGWLRRLCISVKDEGRRRRKRSRRKADDGVMILQTKVDIKKASFEVKPTGRLLFVGSCFADNIGKRFVENQFRAVVNPFGVMYNPASVYHTVERCVKGDGILKDCSVAVFTLGTNHVYILKETGEIVDNCRKRLQALFEERELSVDECADWLMRTVECLRSINPAVRIIFTVSPIRYAKYGFHGSQLSKATLQLAADKVVTVLNAQGGEEECASYFPAYEIMNDELRDYRFYAPDMLHPTQQAVDYIYDCFKEMFFGNEAYDFEREWQPIRNALNHRPFNPEDEEYKAFLAKAKADKEAFLCKWFAE